MCVCNSMQIIILLELLETSGATKFSPVNDGWCKLKRGIRLYISSLPQFPVLLAIQVFECSDIHRIHRSLISAFSFSRWEQTSNCRQIGEQDQII